MRLSFLAAAMIASLWSLQTPAARGGKSPAKKPARTQKVELGTITAIVPGNWAAQPSDRMFRKAEYAVPKAPGDASAPQFIVFHFGKGGGGSVEDNIARWIGMVRQPAGGESSAVAKRGRVERPGLRITTLDVSGTYMERPTPMSDQVTPRPNYRMLAAIVETLKETGDGPYYLRLVGPARSVAAARPGWDTLIASLQAR